MAKTDLYAPRIKPQFDWSGSPGYVTPEEALALNYKYRMADLIYRYKNGQIGDSQLRGGLTQLLDHAEVDDPSARSAILDHPYARTPLNSAKAAPTEENPNAQEVEWGDALGEVWNAFANGSALFQKQVGPSLTAFAILSQQKDFNLLEPLLGRDDVSDEEISELRTQYNSLLKDIEQYGTEMTQAGEEKLKASGYEAPKSIIGQAAESVTTFPADAAVGVVSAIPGALAGAATGALATGGNPVGAVTGASIGGRVSGQTGLQMYTALQLAGETLSGLENSKEYQQLANAVKAKYGWNDAKIKQELLPQARNVTARSTYNERLVSLNAAIDAASGIAVPGFLRKILLDAGTGGLSEAGDTVLQGVGRNKGLIQVAEELDVKEEFLNSGAPIVTDFLDYGAANFDDVMRSAQVGAVAEGATSVITSAAEQKMMQGAEARKVQDEITNRALKLAQEREKLEQSRLKTAAIKAEAAKGSKEDAPVPDQEPVGIDAAKGDIDAVKSDAEKTEVQPVAAASAPADSGEPVPTPADSGEPASAPAGPEVPASTQTKPKLKMWTKSSAQALEDDALATEGDTAFNLADAADQKADQLLDQRKNISSSDSAALKALDDQIAALEVERDFHNKNAELLGEEKARRDAAGSRESSLAPTAADGEQKLKMPELLGLRDALRERYTGLKEEDFVLTQTAEEASKIAGYKIPDNVEGLYNTDGKIYLIGDQIRGKNLKSALKRGVQVAFHEGIGHREIIETLGPDKYREWADKIYQTRKKDVNNWYKNRYKVDEATLTAQENQKETRHSPDRRVDEWLAQNWTEEGVRETALIDNLALGVNKVFRRKRVSDAEILKTYSKIEKSMRKGVVPRFRVAASSRTNVEEDKDAKAKKAAESETPTPERAADDARHLELQNQLDDIDKQIKENERARSETKIPERKEIYKKKIAKLKEDAKPLVKEQIALEKANPELEKKRRAEKEAEVEAAKQKRPTRQRRKRPAEKIKEATKGSSAKAQKESQAKKTPVGARFSQISELNLKQTTPEFRQWFSGSKVTNKNNNPMLMFHGSASGDIERFGPYNFGLFGQGYYFTNNPKVASTYALKGTPTVYPVYLSIKNPMNMDQAVAYNRWRRMFENDPELLADVFPAKKPAYIKTNADAFEEIVNWYARDNTPDYEVGETLMVGFEKEGIDGLTHRGGGRVKKDSTRHRVFIALDPDQIKFAYSKDIKDFEALDAQETKDFEDAFAEIAKQTPRFSERLSGPDAKYYRPRFFDTLFGREKLIVEQQPQRADFDDTDRGTKKFNKAMDRFRKTQLPELGTIEEFRTAIRKKMETAPAELNAKNEFRTLIDPVLKTLDEKEPAATRSIKTYTLGEIRYRIQKEIPLVDVYKSSQDPTGGLATWARDLSYNQFAETDTLANYGNNEGRDEQIENVLRVHQIIGGRLAKSFVKHLRAGREELLDTRKETNIEDPSTLTSSRRRLEVKLLKDLIESGMDKDIEERSNDALLNVALPQDLDLFMSTEARSMREAFLKDLGFTPEDFDDSVYLDLDSDEGLVRSLGQADVYDNSGLMDAIFAVAEDPKVGTEKSYEEVTPNNILYNKGKDKLFDVIDRAFITDGKHLDYDNEYITEANFIAPNDTYGDYAQYVSITPQGPYADERVYLYADFGNFDGIYDDDTEAIEAVNEWGKNQFTGEDGGDFQNIYNDNYPHGVPPASIREILFNIRSFDSTLYRRDYPHYNVDVQAPGGDTVNLAENNFGWARVGEVELYYRNPNEELEKGRYRHIGEIQSDWQGDIETKGLRDKEEVMKQGEELSNSLEQVQRAKDRAEEARNENPKYNKLRQTIIATYGRIGKAARNIHQSLREAEEANEVKTIAFEDMMEVMRLVHITPTKENKPGLAHAARVDNAPLENTIRSSVYNGFLAIENIGEGHPILSPSENRAKRLEQEYRIEQLEERRKEATNWALSGALAGFVEFTRGMLNRHTFVDGGNLDYKPSLYQILDPEAKPLKTKERVEHPYFKNVVRYLVDSINANLELNNKDRVPVVINKNLKDLYQETLSGENKAALDVAGLFAPTAGFESDVDDFRNEMEQAKASGKNFINLKGKNEFSNGLLQEKLTRDLGSYLTAKIKPENIKKVAEQARDSSTGAYPDGSKPQNFTAVRAASMMVEELLSSIKRHKDYIFNLEPINLVNELDLNNLKGSAIGHYLAHASPHANAYRKESILLTRYVDANYEMNDTVFKTVDDEIKDAEYKVDLARERLERAKKGINPIPINFDQKGSREVYKRVLAYVVQDAFEAGYKGIVFANGDQVKEATEGKIEGQRAYYNVIYPGMVRSSPIGKYLTEIEVKPDRFNLSNHRSYSDETNSKGQLGKSIEGIESNTVFKFPDNGTPERDNLKNYIKEQRRNGVPLFSELPADASKAHRASLALRRFFNPYADLEDGDEYRKLRNQTMGEIGNLEEGFRKIADVLSTATRNESKVLYEILTTRDEDQRRELEKKLSTPGLVQAVNEARDAIQETGEMLLNAGLLTDEQLAANEGRYVPNLYLKYLLNEEDSRRFIGGKSVSRMNYLKARKNQTAAMVMDLIKDPALLSAKATIEPRRDLALLNLFENISRNNNWAKEDSLVTVNYADLIEDIVEELGLDYDQLEGIDLVLEQEDDKQLGTFFLEEEAKRLRNDVAPRRDGQMKELVGEFANRLDALVDEAKREMGDYEPSEWMLVPKQARYGAFQGMLIRKEIYDDLIGSVVFANNTVDRWAQNANVIWKWGKVAANIPSWMRNFYSNSMMMHLAGMPVWKQPGYIKRAFQMIYDDHVDGVTDPIFQQFKDAGMVKTTFGANELQRIQREFALNSKLNEDGTPKTGIGEYLSDMEFMLQKVFNFMGDRYQDIEVMSKLAYGMYMMDNKGMDAQTALLASAEPLFDYGEVDNAIRIARRYPIGTPFITWLYKATPFLYKTMTSREGLMRMAPILAMHYGMYYATTGAIEGLMQTEWDEDDRERFLKSQQKWIQKAGPFAMVLPWKDENGNIQIVDTTYLLPYATHAQALQSLVRMGMDDASKDNIIDVLASFGLGGAPLLQLTSGLLWNYDSFRQRELVNDYDDPATHWFKKVVYSYDTMAPAMLSSTGVFSTLIEATANSMGSPTSPGPLNLFAEYALGIPPTVSNMYNRQGEQKRTTGQAALRIAGLNVNAYDIGDEREKRFNTLQYQRRMLRTNYKNEIKALRKAGASEADLRKRREAFKVQDLKLRDRISQLRGSVKVLDDAFYPSAGAFFSEINPL